MNNLNILKKLHTIQASIEKMEKDGKNSFQNYSYLSETQITIKMKNLLDSEKVLFTYSSKITGSKEWDNAKGVKQILTDVEVTYHFFDIESGEGITGIAAGQGIDSGDKGVYKAITGAIKYIYMKTFNIPTGDDPEKDDQPKRVVEKKQATNLDVPDPTDEWPDAHYCPIHKTNLVDRGKGIWDHRRKLNDKKEFDPNGSWYHCQGKGWHLSANQ